jgi:hypothetical protein
VSHSLSPHALQALFGEPVEYDGRFCAAHLELEAAGLFDYDACELTDAGRALVAELSTERAS